MRTRKHTTPLLSALAASMLFSSLLATVSAHGIYRKYDTEGWGQPIISVLMQGLAHQDGAGDVDGSMDADSSSLLADGQTNTGELPDALSGQPGNVVSGSVTSGQQGMDAAAPDGSGSPQGTGRGILDGFGDPQGTDSGASGGQQGTGSAVPGGQQRADSETSGGQQGAGPAVSDGQQGTGSEASGGQQGAGSGAAGGQTGTNSAAPNGSGNPSDTNMSSPDGSGNPQATNPAAPDGSGSQEDSAEPKQYTFTDVPQEYFDDALLIGDSRANGVALYSGWTNLTYYTENGMTIYNMFQSKSATVDGQKLSIEEALQAQSFGKIYLEIGINEMGTGTVDSFIEAYTDAVNHLRELQPDAIIYVCGIMYVKQSKSESDSIFNNPNIQDRNDRIAQLADNETVFYLDINEIVTDETGHLNPDYTWDEVHLLGKYDSLWLDYFSSHGIIKEES